MCPPSGPFFPPLNYVDQAAKERVLLDYLSSEQHVRDLVAESMINKSETTSLVDTAARVAMTALAAATDTFSLTPPPGAKAASDSPIEEALLEPPLRLMDLLPFFFNEQSDAPARSAVTAAATETLSLPPSPGARAASASPTPPARPTSVSPNPEARAASASRSEGASRFIYPIPFPIEEQGDMEKLKPAFESFQREISKNFIYRSLKITQDKLREILKSDAPLSDRSKAIALLSITYLYSLRIEHQLDILITLNDSSSETERYNKKFGQVTEDFGNIVPARISLEHRMRVATESINDPELVEKINKWTETLIQKTKDQGRRLTEIADLRVKRLAIGIFQEKPDDSGSRGKRKAPP